MTVTSITLPPLAAAPATSDFLVVIVTLQDSTKRIDSVTGHGLVWYPAFRSAQTNLAHEVWIAKPSAFSNLVPITLTINAASQNIVAVEHRVANGAGLEAIFSAVGNNASPNVATTSIAASAAVIAAISGRDQALTPASHTYGIRLNDLTGASPTQVRQSLIERRVWTAGPGVVQMGGTTPSATDWIATGLSINRVSTGITKRGNTLGIYVGDPFLYTATQWSADVAEMAQAGDYVLIECPWSSVELSNGTDTWTNIDPYVDAAIGAGLNVILALAYTPLWARVAGATDRYFEMTDATVPNFAAFCGRVVARYKTGGTKGYSNGVDAYQIWNAPNAPSNWKPAPNPSKYAACLKAAYVAIKNQDSNAYVLFGGMDPSVTNVNGFASMYGYTYVSTNPTAYAPGDFLSTCLGTYACQGFFDGIAHHGYWSIANGSLWRPDSATGYPSSPLTNNRNDNGLTVAEDLIDIATFLVPVASQRVLWLTIGQQMAPEFASGETYAQHVNRLQNMIDRWYDPNDSRMQYHGPLLLNTLRDSSGTFFGLRKNDGTAKIDTTTRSLPAEFEGQANRTDERRGTQPISISTTRFLYVGDKGAGTEPVTHPGDQTTDGQPASAHVVKPTGGTTLLSTFPSTVKFARNMLVNPQLSRATGANGGTADANLIANNYQQPAGCDDIDTLSSYITPAAGHTITYPLIFTENTDTLKKTGLILCNGDHGGAVLSGTPTWQSQNVSVTLDVQDSASTPLTGQITFSVSYTAAPWYGAYQAGGEFNLATFSPTTGSAAGKTVVLGPTPGQAGIGSTNLTANGFPSYTTTRSYVTKDSTVTQQQATDNMTILQALIDKANASGKKPCRIYYDDGTGTNPTPWDRSVFAIDDYGGSSTNNPPFVENDGAVVLDLWNLRTTFFDHQHCPAVGGGLRGLFIQHTRGDSNNQCFNAFYLDCNGANQFWSRHDRPAWAAGTRDSGAKHGFYLTGIQPWEMGSDQPNRGTSGQPNVSQVFGFKALVAVENCRGVTGATGSAKGVGGPNAAGTQTRNHYIYDDKNGPFNPVTEGHDETFNLDCHGTFGGDVIEFHADWNDGPYDVNFAGPTQVDGNKWTFTQNSGANGNTVTDTDPPMSYTFCIINRQRHGHGDHAGGNQTVLVGSKLTKNGHTSNDEQGASSESGYSTGASPAGRGVGPSRTMIFGDPLVAEYGQVIFDKIGEGGDWAGEKIGTDTSLSFDPWTGDVGTNCDGSSWVRYDSYGLTCLTLQAGDAATHYTNGPPSQASNHYGLSCSGTGGSVCTQTGSSASKAHIRAFPSASRGYAKGLNSRRTSGVGFPGAVPSAQAAMDVVGAGVI